MSMRVIFYQDTQTLVIEKDGVVVEEGKQAFAGTNKYMGNLFAQGIKDRGPIPSGEYIIGHYSEGVGKMPSGRVELDGGNPNPSQDPEKKERPSTVPLNDALCAAGLGKYYRNEFFIHFAKGEQGMTRLSTPDNGSEGCIIIFKDADLDTFNYLRHHFGKYDPDAVLTVTTKAAELGIVPEELITNVSVYVAKEYHKNGGDLNRVDELLASDGLKMLKEAVYNSDHVIASLPEAVNIAYRRLVSGIFERVSEKDYADIKNTPEYRRHEGALENIRADAEFMQELKYKEELLASAERNAYNWREYDQLELEVEHMRVIAERIEHRQEMFVSYVNNMDEIEYWESVPKEERNYEGVYFYDEMDSTDRYFGNTLNGRRITKILHRESDRHDPSKIYFDRPNEICVAPAGRCRGHSMDVYGKYLQSKEEGSIL